MRIIKRNGAEVGFDITKIIIAITKANEAVAEADRMTPVQIQRIAESVELQCQKMNRAPTVEEIQDMVEHHIMAHGAFEVASTQYGGQSISLTHLARFVQVSREKIRASVRDEFDTVGVSVTEDKINAIAEKRLREEIRRGVQTIQYQVVTLLTTNGQAPFITVFMYLGEARSEQERADLAVIIEEMLLQRYQGV